MILDNWLSDIPAQFRGKEKIEILISAFADELDELVNVFDELKTLTDIDACSGQQLDNIGDIVSLARKDAYSYLLQSQDLTVSDEGYRNVIKYKILQNTSDCTYADIVHGIKLLWSEYSVKYKEDDNQPATYILDLGTYPIGDSSALAKRTMTIRAGGVKVIFLITYTGDPVKWLPDNDTGVLATTDEGYLRTYVSRIKTISAIEHTRGTRVWDGTWMLDGTYLLDAEGESRTRVVQYGKSGIGGELVYDPTLYIIPGRLVVTSEEELTVTEDDELASDEELSVEFQDDGLVVTYEADAELSLEDVEMHP